MIVSLAGVRYALRAQSVLVIFWIYGAYMSLLGLMKFDLGLIPVRLFGAHSTLAHELYFLGSNVLFLATSVFLWRIKAHRPELRIDDRAAMGHGHLLTYIVLYGLGVALYFRAALQLDYTAFVNYDGSAWAQVVFYCGATLVVIAAARKKWLLAVALCIPYVTLAGVLGIRSFVALSIFPVLILLLRKPRARPPAPGGLLPLPRHAFILRKPRFGTWIGMSLVGCAMIFAVVGASLSKHGTVHLPEENLIESYVIVANALEHEPVLLGTESIERFFWGLAAPIFKQIGIRYEREDDPPAIFATYIDDYALRMDEYFHYPSLWQADTFGAFRFGGLLLAPFWAIILISMEHLLRSSPRIWMIFLPLSCWVSFMFARGAVGNATISVSYVILLQVLIYMIFRLLGRNKSRQGSLKDQFSTYGISR